MTGIIYSPVWMLICEGLSSDEHPVPRELQDASQWLRSRAHSIGISRFNGLAAYGLTHQGQVSPNVVDAFDEEGSEWLATHTPFCLAKLYDCRENPDLLGAYSGYLSWNNLEPNKPLLEEIDQLIRVHGWLAVTPAVLKKLGIALSLYATRERIISELIGEYRHSYPEVMARVQPYLTHCIGRSPDTVVYTDNDAETIVDLFIDVFDALNNEDELQRIESWIRSCHPGYLEVFEEFDELREEMAESY
ncbi:hypothetical protein [Sansalvadorimonas verongulae]|uniref:hypothetical protein n=1 Tax=Sansalvadorimonas verongulae TaxID=2172824 RepID=UPI0012BBC879|nr:hypothetical protein [Sansalvadorimonas verongulae]MTI13338.1 hypothetical protein [Sansalvadorimonas verongulae]